MASTVSSVIFFFLGAAMALPYTPNLNPLTARALDPSCAPGGNFDLSIFNLQLPTGSPGSVDQISADKLKGCGGYRSQYFTTAASDGSLVMKVPGSPDSSGCVTTGNSKHCRTELREIKPKSWDPKKNTNRLKVELKLVKADDSQYGTVVGQVKIDDDVSTKPLCELFVNQGGDITLGVSQIPDVSSLKMTPIGNVPVGKKFTYELRYEKSKLSISINGGEFKFLSTGDVQSPLSYFKVGNYNQGNSPSEIHVFSINVTHN